MIKNAIIQIVYDPKRKKPRARYDGGGWVRFPRCLRNYDKTYIVEELKPSKAGSWIACGKIEAK